MVTMLDVMSRNWWIFLVRGAIAIVFGIMALVWPELTLSTLILLFGFYAIFDGVVAIWHGITNRDDRDHRWANILIGVAGILAGLLVIFLPGLSAIALMFLIAAWMIVIGVLEIASAIRLRQVIANEWFLGASGLLSVLLGLFFMIVPGSGALALVTVIGIYAILFGALLIVFSLRLRSL
jgi:uncharacterized membrane protein HdeD (DUF308 family)